jgi:uncharacterized LabA/DUF88 family protein
MRLYKDERTALFIDGSNLYATAKALGFDIDYKSLLNHFENNTRLMRAIYYTALMDDAEYSPIRPLIDWLDYNGFMVVTKPAKEFTSAHALAILLDAKSCAAAGGEWCGGASGILPRVTLGLVPRVQQRL